MACAAGTECSPSGASYEFHVVFSGKGAVTASATRMVDKSLVVVGWISAALLAAFLGRVL